MGCLYYAQGHHSVARNMLHRALNEYGKAVAPTELISFGKGRSYKHLANWYLSNNCDPGETSLETAIDRLKAAIDCYKSSVGLGHPETIACLQQLDKLQSQQ